MAEENLESPDSPAMATVAAAAPPEQQESAADRFRRLSPEPAGAPPAPTESAADRFRRLSPDPVPPVNPSDIVQSASLGAKTPPDQAGRILEAWRQAGPGSGYDKDYVARNLDKVETENRQKAFVDKVANDFSDVSTVSRVLSKDPLKASVFSNPQDVDGLKRAEKALAAAGNPDSSLRPLTPKEVQEQAERWADLRLGSWLTTPMQVGVSPEELRSNTVEMTLQEIRRQEEYIAGAGKAGFLETGKRIHEENPWWFAPFFNMVEPLSKQVDISMAKDRISSGKASLADVEFLERERRYAVAKVMRGEDLGGKMAELASALPAFIGAAGITRPLAQGVESLVIQKGLGAAGNYVLNPTVVGGIYSAAKFSGIASQVATAGAPSLFSDYLERQTDGDPKAVALAKATLAGLINWGSLHIPMNPVAKLMAQETGAVPTVEALVQRMTKDLGKKTFVGTVEGAAGFLGTNEATKALSHVAGVSEYHLPDPTDALAQLLLGAGLGFGHSYFAARTALKNAEAVRDHLKEAEGALQGLTVKASAPGTVSDTVKEIAGDQNVRMAHLDPAEFRDFFQAQNPANKEHPFQLADDLTGKKGALADAILDGQKLQVPLEAWMSEKVKPEDRAFFQDKVKLDPMAPSVEEAQSHLDRLTKEIEEERKAKQDREKLITGDQSVPDYPTAIAKRLREQLEAGGFDKEAASVEALVKSGFSRLQEYATQSGVDPNEFLKKYAPTLHTETPGQPVEGSNYVRVLDQSGAKHIEQVKGENPLEVVQNAQSYWPDSSFEPMTKEEVDHYLKIAMERPDNSVTLEQPAYHGSPHQFDKFSLQKIGSGEGAQSYGWGLYFAGNKDVAKYYREKLSAPDTSTPVGLARQVLFATQDNPERAIKELESRKASSKIPEFAKKADQAIQAIRSGEAFKEGGRLYTVEIPEDSDYLDYDKRLKDQSPKVKEILGPLLSKDVTTRDVGKNEHSGVHLVDVLWDGMTVGAYPEEKVPEVTKNIIDHLPSTGKDFYDHLAQTLADENDREGFRPEGEEFADPEAASRHLNAIGIPGLKYKDQSSRGREGGTSNYVLFDDSRAKITSFEQPEQPAFEKKTPEGPRGRIRIGSGSVDIDLLKTADSSTFVHELGHLYLEALGDLATRETDRSSITVKKDFQTILDWLGVKDRSEIEDSHHEQFARGFERYLMEGEAPTGRLRQVFSKFRDWLVGIYRDVRNLNVDLSPKVRDVFDRLLASDEQIAKAKERAGATKEDFLDAPGLTLSARDRTRLRELEGARDEAAKSVVDARALRDLKQQQTKQWEHAREMMEGQVTEEVNQRPEQIALSLLQKGEMPDGEKLPEGITFKLDRNAIPKLFGEQYSGIDLAALPRGVTTKEGGIHPDLAAELLGFKSGKELVQKLQGLDYKETIRRETDARMEQQVEKPQETLEEDARKAIHNDKEAQIKLFGMKWLAENKLQQHNNLIRAITDPVKYLKQVRDYVGRKVAEIPGGELDPEIYEAGEKDARKKAREAVLAGDYQEAFRWKDKELLNHEFFRAATDAQEEMRKEIPKFDRFHQADEKLGKSRDMNLVSAGRAVMAAFGMGSSDKSPDDYLKLIKAYAPDTYPAVKDLVDNAVQGAVPSDKMTYGQFQDLKTALDALWQLSRDSKTMELAGKTVEKETAIAELTPRVQELGQAFKGQGSKEAISEKRKTSMMLLGIKASIRRVESWCEQVGPMAKKYISDPIFQATAEYREARKENLKGYKDDVQLLDPASFKPRKIEAPELGYTFSGKGEILSAILHTGNDSNQGKLLVGRGWGVRDEAGNLDTSKWDAFRDRMIKEGVITKADYDFAQRVWDRFEALKGPAQQAHRDMYGFYFNELTNRDVATPWGTYKGGYAPARVDPWIYRDQKANEEREALLKNDNSFMFPTTGRGMTKNRAESFSAPLLLSLDLLPGQFDKVLRFTHIEPAVKSVAKLLFDKDFRKTLDAYDPAVVDDMMIPWLQRTAQQNVTQPSKGLAGKALDAMCRWLRTSTGMQMMVANVENALEQTTGIFSTKLQADGVMKALWDYKSDPEAFSKNIADKSIFMRNRSGVQEMELRKRIDDMITFPSQWKKLADFTDTHGYFLQEGVQNIVDKLTWHAAFNEAVEGGKMTDDEAVLHADSVVRQTQFSANPEDMARIESGPPALRMFTMFMSHWNRQLNLLYTEHMKAGDLDGRGAQAMRRAFVWFTGFVMPAIVSQGISKLLHPDEDDGEDHNPAVSLGKFFFGALGSNAVSMVPAVGPLAESIFFGHGDKFGSSPAIESLKRAGHSVVSVPKAIAGDGKPGTAVRDVLTLVGMLTKTPAGALGRPLGYITDVMHGDVESSNPVQIIRGLMTGHGQTRR